MADFISIFLSPLIQAIYSFGVQGATDEYTLYYSGLDDICRDLDNHLIDVKNQVTEAENEGEEIWHRVQNWIERSGLLVKETNAFLEPEEDLRSCCCFVFLSRHGCLCCCRSDGRAINCLRCCCSNANSCLCRPKKRKAAEVLVNRIEKQLEVGNFPNGFSYQRVPTTSGPSRAPYVEIASQQAQLKMITELLGGGEVSVIGVYGDKGSGKSTLIDKVAMEVESNNQFNAVVKLTMGERDVWDIQLDIAEKIGLKLPLLEDPRARARWLHDMLAYLEEVVFIIDDVEKEVDLNEIGIPWPDHNNGCRIVLVSRSFERWGKIRTQLDLELEVIPFSNDELRELNFHKKKPNMPDKLQTLNHNMERLERKASDIRDEVQQEVLRNRKRIREEVKLWLERVEGIRLEVQNVSGEVEDSALEGMTKQVDELIEKSDFPRGLVIDDFKPEGDELVTEKLEGSTPLMVKDKVWSAFRRGESRVGILGMGGVGKTTVAMNLNDEFLAGRDDFKHVYYVTVSRDSSVDKLQRDISREMQFDLQFEDHETRRAGKLRKALKDRKKSLLILDDVWENIHLEKVGVAVEGDGCNLLITTRNRGVCRRMKCSTIVEMKPLSEDEAWDLFVCKLGNYEQLSDEAKRIARSICKKCSGLPLAIITMAGCMRGEFDEHVWRDTLRQLRNPCSNHDDMDREVFSILKHSYERLKNHKLRECLLYCAMYPEDYEIEWDDLIKDFIAAGLLDGSTRKDNIDMGHSNLNALASASLLECVTGFGGMRRVKMHDLIRDMALIIIGRTGIVKPIKGLKEIPRKDEWTKDLVRVSLMDNDIDDIGDDICPECPNLSLLILRGNPLLNISDSFFAHMAGLTYLDLSETRIVKLPNSVANLCNLCALLLNGCHGLEVIPSLAGLTKLRYLNLHKTAIVELPEGVGELRNLEHLDLSGTLIEELPEGVAELINLEHLDLSETGIQNIPGGLLCKLCKLETFLSNSKISIFPKELTSLRQLSSFAGCVPDFDAFKQFIGSDCFSQLKKYFFHVGGPVDFNISSESCDRLITIDDCQLSMRREVCFEVPHNVQILELIGCSFGVECLLEALPSLCAATELERCKLEYCKGIKYIIPDAWFEGRGVHLDDFVVLELSHLDDFVGLYEGRGVHLHIFFGGLKELSFHRCPSVNKIWLPNDDILPNLEFITVQECSNMEEVFAAAEGASVKLPCLKRISLWNLSELKSISGSNVLLPCLDDVDVEWCPKLEMLWSVKDQLPSLQMKQVIATTDETTIPWAKFWRLVLKGLPELKSIWGNGVFFPKLDWLIVSECPKLKKLGLLNHNMPSLSRISITECREMEEIFERVDGAGDDAIQLPNLVEICLRDLPELRSICRNTVVCNSLERVTLSGYNKLENCPISVPRLLLSNDPTLWKCCVEPKDWWNSLNWNDPATKLALDKLS